MDDDPLHGPAELVLMASVARHYYLDGRSKLDIAAQMGISRFKVARLLEDARARGVVRIEISSPGLIDLETSSRLQEAFGLTHCVVIATPDLEATTLRRHLGRAAAQLLGEIVTPDDVLGLAWARSLSAMGAALTKLAPCEVVQLSGALQRADVAQSPIELVREVARVGGGPAYFFYAPMIVASAATAAALRTQPEVARTFARYPSVTKALVGIGSWDPPFSTVYDALDAPERRQIAGLGVIGEVSGVLIDARGRPIAAPLIERTIAISGAQLERVPTVIALAYGMDKTVALEAALTGRLVDGLVTHGELARALLERRERGGRP